MTYDIQFNNQSCCGKALADAIEEAAQIATATHTNVPILCTKGGRVIVLAGCPEEDGDIVVMCS